MLSSMLFLRFYTVNKVSGVSMARINLWKPNKGKDYGFVDRTVKDYMDLGGTGVIVHLYTGSGDSTDITDIQDVLFLENRDRKYSDSLYDLKGCYQPQNSEFDLSQFGIFLTNDTIFISFHYMSMLDQLGRKLMSGDVLELPHLRDPDSLDDTAPALDRYYVIQDATHSAEGYGPGWYSHIWRVKAQQLKGGQEYNDILGVSGIAIGPDGEELGPAGCYSDSGCSVTNDDQYQSITDGIVSEASQNVMFDPTWVDSAHFYIGENDDGSFNLFLWAGTGIPPNGYPLKGEGTEFPEDMQDGEFFLRTDYTPDRLFRRVGNKYIKIEDDARRKWTPVNMTLDSFMNNDNVSTNSDCTTTKEKQAISKAVKARVNLNEDKYNEIYNKKK